MWLHSSEHRTGVAEVTGSNLVEALTFFRLIPSNPVEALMFFRRLPSNSLNWKIYCDDHSSLLRVTLVCPGTIRVPI